jgi:hypothetical protein
VKLVVSTISVLAILDIFAIKEIFLGLAKAQLVLIVLLTQIATRASACLEFAFQANQMLSHVKKTQIALVISAVMASARIKAS